jgi:hypothetical protein
MPRRFDREAFTSRLRQTRLEAYMDGGIPSLAEALGLPPMTWANYEMGVVVPDSVILEFVCLTGVSPRWLLTGEGQPFLSHSLPSIRNG